MLNFRFVTTLFAGNETTHVRVVSRLKDLGKKIPSIRFWDTEENNRNMKNSKARQRPKVPGRSSDK